MGSNRTGWLLLAPTLIILGGFGIVPFIYVLWVSFHQWNPFGANPAMIYNGADNFRRLVFDTEFLQSVWFTMQFGFFAVVSEIVIGYLLAQLLMRDFPGKSIFRTIHTLPLIVAPIVVAATLNVAHAILAESYISFLGFGIQPPTPSWGNMLESAQSYLTSAPWLAIIPGAAITLAVTSFNFIGDGLRDALDPKL